MARTAWVGFGANLGRPARTWRCVVDAVLRSRSLRLLGISPLYLTEPLSPIAQPWYTNAVFAVASRLEPVPLVLFLRRLERRLGRRRGVERRWGPRKVDLDLLIFGKRVLRNHRLILPHPRMHERRFVLQPLADLNGALQHPVWCKTIDKLLKEVDDPSGIGRLPRMAPTPLCRGAVTRVRRAASLGRNRGKAWIDFAHVGREDRDR
ncbi:MAG: 2-amino-4-hydroxy-6-hydroxymethyldihydropteridine diphosphokinase [Magnetococcales bacterium]|nr:2-amino-4-hydroxy-6-hydroxymethyldihydropteridine diphosphokinase [Magnetococcales bacterium]MBF0322661.1 2-amino-4-hydroxy-6-hydroxymethyldihydropteridine diphosphokinase [Magnetococcales bacterium]